MNEWERLRPAVRRYLQQIEQLIDEAFVREDLPPLCKTLGVDADQVITEEKQALVRFLLLTMTGQQRLEELIEELVKRRPRVDWPAVPDEVKLTAEELLAAMPVDEIPAPGQLPDRSRMPLKRNLLFTGREADLRALVRSAMEGETATIREAIALTGMGGIGKTQLAAEFAHRYGRYYAGGVYWLSFGETEGVPAEVAACGLAMDLGPYFAEMKLEDQVLRVRGIWEEETPRLLVFDNCEEEELLREWRPMQGGAWVIVTSRRGSWGAALGVRPVALGVLSLEESIALLQKFRPDLEGEAAEKITEEVGYLPLALHLAGSYLKRYEKYELGRPETYLAELRRPDLLQHASLIGHKVTDRPVEREMHVARTFAISYERLDPANETDAMALALLARAACFAPGQAIPRELLKATVTIERTDAQAEDGIIPLIARLFGQAKAKPEDQGKHEGLGDRKGLPLQVVDGLERLARLGLLEVEEDESVVVHRLVAAFVKGEIDEERFGQVQTTVEEAVAAGAEQINAAGLPGPLLDWQGHLRHVADEAAKRGSENAGWLANELGNHLNMIGDYRGARATFERALSIDEAALGPDHPNVAVRVNNLGLVLWAQGDYEGARAAYERALKIGETAFQPDHAEVATFVNNLGLVLRAEGDYEGARAAFERALTIDEVAFGPDHPNVARDVNNLGEALRAQGDYEGARAAFERALAIDEAAFGPDHPNVARELSNLGLVLEEQGDYAGARAAFERALAIGEATFGSDHPNVASFINNLGLVLLAQGDYEGAKVVFKRALAIDEAVFGPDHPEVAIDVNNLGKVLHDQGDYEGARAAYERALAIDEAAFGPDHPEVATFVNNLGKVLHDQGDYEGARAALERALKIDEVAFGPDHLKVAIRFNKLGELLKEQGDYEGAKAAFERALAIFDKSPGPDHPNTQIARKNLEALKQKKEDK